MVGVAAGDNVVEVRKAGVGVVDNSSRLVRLNNGKRLYCLRKSIGDCEE